jgi:hypothetical protein
MTPSLEPFRRCESRSGRGRASSRRRARACTRASGRGATPARARLRRAARPWPLIRFASAVQFNLTKSSHCYADSASRCTGSGGRPMWSTSLERGRRAARPVRRRAKQAAATDHARRCARPATCSPTRAAVPRRRPHRVCTSSDRRRPDGQVRRAARARHPPHAAHPPWLRTRTSGARGPAALTSTLTTSCERGAWRSWNARRWSSGARRAGTRHAQRLSASSACTVRPHRSRPCGARAACAGCCAACTRPRG